MRRVLCALLFLAAAAATGQAPAPAPAPADDWAGSEACLACHEDAAASLRHVGGDAADPECESCHGPGWAHVESGGEPDKIRRLSAMAPREQSDTCRSCHVGGKTTHWDGSTHEQHALGCLSCHTVHDPTGRNHALLVKSNVSETCYDCHALQRVQMMRTSHMPVREGKMDCADCHNPHGSVTEGLLHDRSINDNCYRCHADKRGPVLFEHPPVRENCLNCHHPHGSIHESMLISRPPRLCQNCHINSRHPSEPRLTVANRFVFNKGCVNCHSQIHGSNHPSGIRAMR
jgi:DmsE family decaheme c-type cytochrome